MELSVINSRALEGIEAPPVQVEVHLSNGLPSFHIVGMPETAVRESKERVRSALLTSHFEFPDRRITVNLAPADLPKEGGRFDLPIALGILVASGQLVSDRLGDHEFLGELALDGRLRAVSGAINAAKAATVLKRRLVVPSECAPLAAYVPDSKVLPAEDILTLCAYLNGRQDIEPASNNGQLVEPNYPDLAEVVGQASARRALEIAACGAHNILFCGPPGTGKTLLASRLPGILPPLDMDEALTGLAVRNICNQVDKSHFLRRPFRNPHHSASPAALVGGGSKPRPGEISLAHGGVLFLDELPEFTRHALEMLREPMESGEITLSRARHKTTYPARFQLVAAMNPCFCGYYGDPEKPCHCSSQQLSQYRQRLSGPLLDRIDMHIDVARVPPALLLSSRHDNEPSKAVRARVCTARKVQMLRQGSTNADIPHREIASTCLLGNRQSSYIEQVMTQLNLSARAVHRSLRVARTIADLEGTHAVQLKHLNEAFAYRNPEFAL
jgi:magnesium chelatase family protein